MKNEILNFIQKRFSIDCDWMTKNCYWFARILCIQFTFLSIYYQFDVGHFIAVDRIQKVYYDYEGEHSFNDSNCVELSSLLYNDPAWYCRLMRDCKD